MMRRKYEWRERFIQNWIGRHVDYIFLSIFSSSRYCR